MNVTAQRVVAAMAAAGIDQPALAADLGVSQGSISKIVSGKTLNSRLLPRIAVRLRQSLPYLLGETDDPGATPPAPPSATVVLLHVQLPDVDSLTAMFEGLLDGIDPKLSQDARARLLAERLPIGLSQLADALPDRPRKRRPGAREEARADLAMSDHEPAR